MKESESKDFLKRRLTLAGGIAIIILLLFLLLFLPSPVHETPPAQPANMTILPTPIYEKEPLPLSSPDNGTGNETVTEPETNCTLAPIPELGCLQPNEEQNIFGAAGLDMTDSSVRDLIKLVEKNCETGSNGFVDRDCIIDTAVYNSQNSWVCNWKCLRDMSSCETYKMHLATAILRRYVPPTDVFVARTKSFHFFIVYKDNRGQWMQKFSTSLTMPTVEALYNDVYHAGPITEVVFPKILEVEKGNKFCFDVYANRSCTCSVKVLPFTVGNCPQLPADLRGVCSAPVSEVYLDSGQNSICFTVAENATGDFYTYDFTLTSGEDYIPAGNAFMKYKQWDCCVNASFTGFLSIV